MAGNSNGKSIKSWHIGILIAVITVILTGWGIMGQTVDKGVSNHDTCTTAHPDIRQAIADNKVINTTLTIRVDSLISQGRTQYVKDSIIREQQYRDLLQAIKESNGG